MYGFRQGSVDWQAADHTVRASLAASGCDQSRAIERIVFGLIDVKLRIGVSLGFACGDVETT
ncbi:MAG: hypothetical protein ABIW82_07890 [Dokdonella sp.]